MSNAFLDILLVRYCPNKLTAMQFNNTLATVSQWPNAKVYIHDNTKDNIGLVKARNLLLAQSSSPLVLLMDFDFDEFKIDLEAMCNKIQIPAVGMVVPYWRGSHLPTDWQTPTRIGCNFMMLRHEVLLEVGGLDERYHTARADWDLIHRIIKNGYYILQHNRSWVGHIPTDKDPNKEVIYEQDRLIYEAQYDHGPYELLRKQNRQLCG